ncbi:hypothetical protein K437DRAFT_254094 [Tilletiaria anomala UBC 951]|uniref:non-specific serine/threonine protein kinase n=1 Tax=Tilletiaria anomala (strain ATCC 24038 / CBS 436.72 / UBC 951) TaxID=1037660 RepID=A0A066WPF7_TILAU|nr:uncharacterized protein K437DRAFT_254094 [Tilletiaria anomala UBC 951]KDN52510.1 hypothetical protein K437DRAFT_254094 [Tilletiaria anomala UBC 951]
MPARAQSTPGRGSFRLGLFPTLCVICLLTFAVSQTYGQHGVDGSNDEPQALPRPGLAASRDADPSHGLIPSLTISNAGDLKLLDIAMVTCTDGSLHGVERDTGNKVWSITSQASQIQSDFGPSIRSSYGPRKLSFAEMMGEARIFDPAKGASEDSGLYVLEPTGNGDIYILVATGRDTHDADAAPHVEGPRRGLKLRKLPLNVPQLITLSPFSFPGDDSRVFIGKKESRLVEVNARTGEIGAIYGGDAIFPASPERQNHEQNHRLSDHQLRVNPGDPSSEGEWALIGRTDYSLSIHAKHDPSYTQTLHLSLYTPNLADRDILSAWSSMNYPDSRRLLSLPEESSLLCLDMSSSRSHETKSEGALWTSNFESSVASIFDFVKVEPSTGQDGNATPHSASRSRPVLIPHPTVDVSSIIIEHPARSHLEGDAKDIFLGFSGDSLFAMSSDRYPLVVLSPPAPLSHILDGSAKSGANGHQHDLTWHDAPSRRGCGGISCWTGAYRVQNDDVAEWAMREALLGSAPLLGIGGREVDHASSRTAFTPIIYAPPSSDRAGSSAPDARSDDVRRSPNSTLSTLLLQAVLIISVTLVSWAIWTGLRLQERQKAIEAKAFVESVIYVPIHPPSADGTRLPLEASGASPEIRKVSQRVIAEGKAVQDNNQDAGEQPQANVQDQHEMVESGKSSVAKRRRRGKRAGQAVAAKLAKVKETCLEEVHQEHIEPPPDRKPHETSGRINPAAVHDPRSRPLPNGSPDNTIAVKTATQIAPPQPDAAAIMATKPAEVSNSTLTLSDEVLGYGSSGTVVFKGTFQGRAVAVKRLLKDFVSVASKEVSLLESADDHPNVVRYFYKEMTESFLYIALELCSATLADVIEKPLDYRDLGNQLEPKRALSQITHGLLHLHNLSIVHRDLKPQNILVTLTTKGKLKMLLSDFGLSKKLDGFAQSSFSQTVNNPGGTVGWRAPEILRGEVSMDAGSESTEASSELPVEKPSNEEKTKLTRAVDIFALGCIYYYLLSNGDHPFGSRFERELNVLRGRVDLTRLDTLGEEGNEAKHLIFNLINSDPTQRASAQDIISHPYFWDSSKRLSFLTNASDRFDTMERDPPAPALVSLESGALDVIGKNWQRRLDQAFVQDLGKFRSYDPKKLQDLLRAMRNKSHHFQDMQPRLQQILGPLPEGFLNYFTQRFPKLFLHVYAVIIEQPLLQHEARFKIFFQSDQE